MITALNLEKVFLVLPIDLDLHIQLLTTETNLDLLLKSLILASQPIRTANNKESSILCLCPSLALIGFESMEGNQVQIVVRTSLTSSFCQLTGASLSYTLTSSQLTSLSCSLMSSSCEPS